MLGKAGSLEGADTDMGDDRGRGCPLLGGLELPVGGLGVASWWPEDLGVVGRKCQLVAWSCQLVASWDLEFFTKNFLVTLLQIFCTGKVLWVCM